MSLSFTCSKSLGFFMFRFGGFLFDCLFVCLFWGVGFGLVCLLFVFFSPLCLLTCQPLFFLMLAWRYRYSSDIDTLVQKRICFYISRYVWGYFKAAREHQRTCLISLWFQKNCADLYQMRFWPTNCQMGESDIPSVLPFLDVISESVLKYS